MGFLIRETVGAEEQDGIGSGSGNINMRDFVEKFAEV